MTSRSGRRTRGFSLFEVMVTLGVVLALAVALGSFVGDISRGRERLGVQMARQRAAEAVLLQLERALATTVVEDSLLGTGVRGSGNRLEVVSRGVSAWRLGDQSAAERALEDRERLVVTGGSVGVENSASFARGESARGELPLTIRFRYFDGESWQASFDSKSSRRLPHAVEVCLWWTRPGDAVEDDILALADLEDETADEPAALEDEGFDELEIDPSRIGGVGRDELGGPARAPDRVRVIAIPDAAVFARESDSSTETSPPFEPESSDRDEEFAP